MSASVLDGGHVFSAGTYLPTEGNLSDYPEWKPFEGWFEHYMGYMPNDARPQDVEFFEAFYAGRIYQTEARNELSLEIQNEERLDAFSVLT